MRPKNRTGTKRAAQPSLSENTDRILEEMAEWGHFGKSKAEVAARIINDWLWTNEDRLNRQGIAPRRAEKLIRPVPGQISTRSVSELATDR